MLAKLILAGVAVSLVSASRPEIASSDATGRFRLTCTGTMTPGSVAPMPVTANGLLDFDRMRVSGFGVGSEPVVYLTDAVIGFGSVHPEGGKLIEGSIDRRSGRTRLVMRDPGHPLADAMTMDLVCRFEPLA